MMQVWASTSRIRLRYLVAIPRMCRVESKRPREDRSKEAKTNSDTVEQSELLEMTHIERMQTGFNVQ